MKTGKLKKKTSTSLSHRALLVSVNISQWAGRKLDHKATETANTVHRAENGAGSYTKKLLPGAIELAAVNTISSQARKFYYEQTLPWMSNGTRIISGKNYLKFQTEIRKTKALFESAVKDFEAAYPRLKQEAKLKLGDLFSEDEYPDDIAGRFSFAVDFFPLPDADDFRVKISDVEKRTFERRLKETETVAMRDAGERLLGVVKAAVEKLKDPNAIFRDSLLENISEVSALIPLLNISNDRSLDAISEQAKLLIDSVDAQTLRVDAKKRDKTRKALKDIEARMGAFMGGLK